jgi:hypothetical protein
MEPNAPDRELEIAVIRIEDWDDPTVDIRPPLNERTAARPVPSGGRPRLPECAA